MAVVESGVKRKFSVSDKNDRASDTSEELSDTSHLYQVLQEFINITNA
jgi:hypothetical protein